MEAVESLRSQGHEVVPFEIPYSMAQLVETYIALMGADGNWCVSSFSFTILDEQFHRHYYLKSDLSIPSRSSSTLISLSFSSFLPCRALEGEDLYDSYKLLQVYTEIPNFLRPWVSWLLNLSGESRKAKLVEATASGPVTVS
jgi:hypothetical protein